MTDRLANAACFVLTVYMALAMVASMLCAVLIVIGLPVLGFYWVATHPSIFLH